MFNVKFTLEELNGAHKYFIKWRKAYKRARHYKNTQILRDRGMSSGLCYYILAVETEFKTGYTLTDYLITQVLRYLNEKNPARKHNVYWAPPVSSAFSSWLPGLNAEVQKLLQVRIDYMTVIIEALKEVIALQRPQDI